jgi:hypothetical protein
MGAKHEIGKFRSKTKWIKTVFGCKDINIKPIKSLSEVFILFLTYNFGGVLVGIRHVFLAANDLNLYIRTKNPR